MKISPCYVCKTPIPELQVEEGKFSFRCQLCGCATKFKAFPEAVKDWNGGYTYPVSCMECANGDGTWKPCDKGKDWGIMVACGHFEKRGGT